VQCVAQFMDRPIRCACISIKNNDGVAVVTMLLSPTVLLRGSLIGLSVLSEREKTR
jgi:hypothetical protein